MKKLILITALLTLLPQSPAKAGQGKDFIMSVVYGTLAGTLVGAATLAFTSNPGDNLNNVARGASYGLYAGILLGLYVTYGLDENEAPAPKKPDEEEKPDKLPEPQVRLHHHLSHDRLVAQSATAPDLKLSFQPYLILPGNDQASWGMGVQVLQYNF